jgi:hypothetical protein
MSLDIVDNIGIDMELEILSRVVKSKRTQTKDDFIKMCVKVA